MNDGSIGELACAAHFAHEGYDIFLDTSGKASFDFVVHKNGILQRVQVKTTTRRTPEDTGWQVYLNIKRHNRSRTVTKHFDNTSCDLLAVFIKPEKRVVVLDASTIKPKTEIVVY